MLTNEIPVLSEKGVVRQPVLTSNFFWTLAGNLVYAACQWGVLMAFAKLGNVEMVGQYSLGLAITAPVFQFCGLQLRAVQVTDARSRYTFGEFAGMRILTTAAGLAIIGAIALFGQHHGTTALVVLLIGVSKSIESLTDLCQGLFQKNERMDRVAKSLIIKGLASVLAVVTALEFSGGPAVACSSLVIAWALVWVGYDLRSAVKQLAGVSRAVLPHIAFSVFRRLFVLTLPLGFVMMVLSLNANLPRYFLEKYSGEASVGIFSALAYCVVAGNMVMGALGQSASPRLAKLHSDGDVHGFCVLVAKLVAFGAVTGIMGLIAVRLAGTQILTLFYRPEYSLHVNSFFWLMAAGIVMNVSGVLGVAVTAMQAFKQQVWIQLACLATGVVASSVLIPRMGILGASLSVLILAIAALFGYTIQLWLMIADRSAALPVVTVSL